MSDIMTLLATPVGMAAIVAAVVALVRDRVPSLDGWRVLAFALGLGLGLGVAMQCQRNPVTWYLGFAPGFAAAALACGVTSYLGRLVGKVGTDGNRE